MKNTKPVRNETKISLSDLLNLDPAPEGRRYVVIGHNGWGSHETSAFDAFLRARSNMAYLPDEGCAAGLWHVDPETTVRGLDGGFTWPTEVDAPVQVGVVEFDRTAGRFVDVLVRVGSTPDLEGATWASPDETDRLDVGPEDEGDPVGIASFSPREAIEYGLDPMANERDLRAKAHDLLVTKRGFPSGIRVEDVYVD